MKVLYIGNYRDGTGWSNACINNILAMDAAGIDVVPRAISFNVHDKDYTDKIKSLEIKHNLRSSNLECDVVVQHTLPHLYCYDASYKNIGFLAVESHDFRSTNWHRSINLMDELWVPNSQSKESAIRSGVDIPIKVVPHSLDMSRYGNTEGQKIQELQNTFTFGFVGEFVERKNIKALIKAFHIEFTPKEPVTLLLKTSRAELPEIQAYCNTITRGLKIRGQYKPEVVIAGMMDRQDYISILSQVDCFVMPSRGEAFCIPALESMALGTPSIYTDGIGMDYCVGESVESRLEPCFGAVDTLPNLDTADTMWREINVKSLCKTMRSMYNKLKSEDGQKLKASCIERSKDYDHKAIGNKIRGILNDG
tara:strand:+ start:366 stop:1460 length:1095 start_codon:yes stop_codon:yes gene_type:complete